MNADSPSCLELHIHLCDGHIARFRQEDPEEARNILCRLQPEKVFAQRHLILASAHSVTVYPCAAIARIDCITDARLHWPFHRNVVDMVEITAEEFERRFDPRTDRIGRGHQGEILRAFGELELAHGGRIVREVYLCPPLPDTEDERVPLDRNILFKQLFQAPSLHFRRRGGGVILINPAHVVRMTFYPGPADAPENAWRVEPVQPPHPEMVSSGVPPVLQPARPRRV